MSDAFEVVVVGDIAFIRAGTKVIEAGAISTIEPARGDRHGRGGQGTVIHYAGSDGRPLHWMLDRPFEEVWGAWRAAGKIVSAEAEA